MFIPSRLEAQLDHFNRMADHEMAVRETSDSSSMLNERLSKQLCGFPDYGDVLVCRIHFPEPSVSGIFRLPIKLWKAILAKTFLAVSLLQCCFLKGPVLYRPFSKIFRRRFINRHRSTEEYPPRHRWASCRKRHRGQKPRMCIMFLTGNERWFPFFRVGCCNFPLSSRFTTMF